MEVISKIDSIKIRACTNCNSVLRWNPNDLQLDCNEQNYYYIVCPICHSKLWIKRINEIDDMYNDCHKKNEED